MAKLDPRALRPAELARLLNSTPLGEAVQAHTLYRQRNRAGYRIGDGKTVDLIRYVAWLARERHEPRPERDTGTYEDLKERARDRNARLSARGDARCACASRRGVRTPDQGDAIASHEARQAFFQFQTGSFREFPHQPRGHHRECGE